MRRQSGIGIVGRLPNRSEPIAAPIEPGQFVQARGTPVAPGQHPIHGNREGEKIGTERSDLFGHAERLSGQDMSLWIETLRHQRAVPSE